MKRRFCCDGSVILIELKEASRQTAVEPLSYGLMGLISYAYRATFAVTVTMW